MIVRNVALAVALDVALAGALVVALNVLVMDGHWVGSLVKHTVEIIEETLAIQHHFYFGAAAKGLPPWPRVFFHASPAGALKDYASLRAGF
jgi:hypothetical protein